MRCCCIGSGVIIVPRACCRHRVDVERLRMPTGSNFGKEILLESDSAQKKSLMG